MEITEVRIKLTSANNDKLRAFCSITIDNDFVIRDLKVIEGAKGPFVAMPSRKLTQRCPRCGGKNPHRANFCSDCGCKLPPERLGAEYGQRQKLHADIAHPINSRCRETIQKRILEQYAAELEKAKDPNYTPPDLDVFDEEYLGADSTEASANDFASRPGSPVESLAEASDEHGRGAIPREGSVSSREGALERAEFSDWPGSRDTLPFEEEAASSGAGSLSPAPQLPSVPAMPAGHHATGGPRGGGGAGTGYFRERGQGHRQRERSREGLYSQRGGGRGGRRRDFDRNRRQQGQPGAGGPRLSGPRGRRDFTSGEGGAYRSAASEEARGDDESRSRPFSVQSDLPRGDSPGLPPSRHSFSEKRPMPAEAETEPEDNFGAGLFS